MNDGINVLSLFDGISCGKIALDRVKKKLDNGRTRWDIDTDIPVFKDEGREYIDSLIHF